MQGFLGQPPLVGSKRGEAVSGAVGFRGDAGGLGLSSSSPLSLDPTHTCGHPRAEHWSPVYLSQCGPQSDDTKNVGSERQTGCWSDPSCCDTW